MRATQGDAYRSTIQLLGSQTFVRALSFGKGVLVARFLLPHELGQFVLVAAVLGLLELATAPGMNEAVVAAASNNARSLASAWTLIVLRGLLLSSLLFFFAGTIAEILGNPDLVGIIQIMALLPMIRSFFSLSPILSQRRLDIRPQAVVSLATAVSDAMTSTVLVALTGAPWGLAVGAVAGATVGAMTTHGFGTIPRRPDFSWKSLIPYLSFARWRWLSTGFWYLSTQVDDLLLGKLAGTHPLGIYRLAFTLGYAPATETASLLVQITFPTLAKVNREDPRRVASLYERYLLLTAGISGSLAALLFIVARPLSLALLGETWAPVAIPLAILAIASFVRAILATGGAFFLAVGLPQYETLMQVVRAGVLIPTLLFLVRFGAVGAALASAASVGFAIPIWIWALSKGGVSIRSIGQTLASRIPLVMVVVVSSWATLKVVGGGPVISLASATVAAGLSWIGLVRWLDPKLFVELKVFLRRAFSSSSRVYQRPSEQETASQD